MSLIRYNKYPLYEYAGVFLSSKLDTYIKRVTICGNQRFIINFVESFATLKKYYQ